MASQEQIKTAILKAGVWQFGSYRFASGKEGDNKFEMPLVLKNATAKRLLLPALCEKVGNHDPDVLWGVPSGGQEFANEVGKRLKLPVIQLQTVEKGGTKEVEYLCPSDGALAAQANRAVGIEDVVNEGTSIVRSLRLPELSETTVAIVACWIRGISLVKSSIPVEGVIEEPVPNFISPSHPFYERYGGYAVHDDYSSA